MARHGFGVQLSMYPITDGFVDTSVLLNPANAERIVDTLCRVRGAALKLGQVIFNDHPEKRESGIRVQPRD